MDKLVDIVAEPAKRQEVVGEAINVLEQEVSGKSGLGGIAIKGAYKMAKGLAPGLIQKVVNGLLDDFLNALQPFYEESKAKNADVSQHMTQSAPAVANALLAITDSRADRHEGGPLKKGYLKLRPTAQKHVEQAVPRLGGLVKKYTS